MRVAPGLVLLSLLACDEGGPPPPTPIRPPAAAAVAQPPATPPPREQADASWIEERRARLPGDPPPNPGKADHWVQIIKGTAEQKSDAGR